MKQRERKDGDQRLKTTHKKNTHVIEQLPFHLTTAGSPVLPHTQSELTLLSLRDFIGQDAAQCVVGPDAILLSQN